MRTVQNGDRDAYGRLVEAYLDEAYAFALGLLHEPAEAEDAVQDAFIRALERIHHLEDGSPFGPWFYRVLRSVCHNLRRRESLRSHPPVPRDAAGGSDPEEVTFRRLDRETVLGALERLPEMQRMTVMLYELEGYTHREVGEVLDISPGTSRAHLHHARNKLRKILAPVEEETDE